ncbi:short chain dehydrogenase domain-containing protein [Ditylenchus destructor]|nr:short chain dehydrogenase domain-containing protein [Ditylenchus destructor]
MVESRPLKGQVALVTGASRGIGRGIAIQLGEAGAKVFITGRRPSASYSANQTNLPSLEQTVKEITSRGGEAVAIYCDHANSEDVRKLFERVEAECNGNLDILVNNAYSGIPSIINNVGRKFYECEPEFWDDINEVGLRNYYFCAVYAARMMAKNKNGLIVHIGSAGGLQYFFNVPYGVGKAGIDRMAADMAIELKAANVAVVCLWPGIAKTELTAELLKKDVLHKLTGQSKESMDASMKRGESTEFVGKAVVALAGDKKVMKKSGRILLTADLASEYRFRDANGVMPANIRSVRTALELFGFIRLARWIPAFIKIPKICLHFASYKF